MKTMGWEGTFNIIKAVVHNFYNYNVYNLDQNLTPFRQRSEKLCKITDTCT